jgi:two-component system sensor histidine kinase/response regulator
MQADRDHCLAAGMNDHVAKPIEPEDLWMALLKWIKPKEASIGADISTSSGHAPAANVLRQQARPEPSRRAGSYNEQFQTQVADLPSAIAGLDMTNGLRRVLGKKALYLSMLRKFVAGQKSAPDEILKALGANDWNGAERIAHTLKGVSGNIGATDLQQLADKFEAAIRERRPRDELDGLLSALKNLLKHLIAQLEQNLPKEQVMTSIPVDTAKLKMVCDKLKILLTDDDAAAADVLEANAQLLSAAFPGHYQKIAAAIQSFNFKAALTALGDANGTSTKG